MGVFPEREKARCAVCLPGGSSHMMGESYRAVTWRCRGNERGMTASAYVPLANEAEKRYLHSACNLLEDLRRNPLWKKEVIFRYILVIILMS